MTGKCSMSHGNDVRCANPASVDTLCCGAVCWIHGQTHEGCPFGEHMLRKPGTHEVGGAFLREAVYVSR